jgi:hypothetical protein
VRNYRLILAVLVGTGFSSLITLLLNLRGSVVLLLSILMFPGGLIASFLPHSQELDSPLSTLAANGAAYSGLAFLLLTYSFSKINIHALKRSAIAITLPVIALTLMACVPSLNPLWPREMEKLAQEENDLRQGLPIGEGVTECRDFLRSRKIEFYEVELRDQQEITRRGGPPMIAQAGDRLISARVFTDAGQWPCGYAIEVALIFDANDALKDSRVNRLRLCP